MYTFLLILLALDSLVLIAVILMQAGQGGGMAATFGGASSSAGTIFGTRPAGNLLTKASWWCGGVFLGPAFLPPRGPPAPPPAEFDSRSGVPEPPRPDERAGQRSAGDEPAADAR